MHLNQPLKGGDKLTTSVETPTSTSAPIIPHTGLIVQRELKHVPDTVKLHGKKVAAKAQIQKINFKPIKYILWYFTHVVKTSILDSVLSFVGLSFLLWVERRIYPHLFKISYSLLQLNLFINFTISPAL